MAKKVTKAKAAPAKKPVKPLQTHCASLSALSLCAAKAAKETMDDIIGTVTASLKKNQKVQITGFGAFTVTKRAARKGRNPSTGESIRIKAGQTLKNSI